MNKILYKILFVVIITAFSTEAIAAPRPPSPPGKDKKAPIDMGLTLLLLAGSGLGIVKIKKNKKDTQ
ncbi:hypothetical protein FHR24_000909 [Wenyingzhuangia heitensis]|uniref:LPXTG-motif cell wall anchor domain-containing protein n=1 Tax=Wenyingzhuangia heitensis TaxID=1487859 RepID=A0ABX0U9K2_9FLAO|nr:hypothetical protein [Wenyingzhuangia heitensis]NIJ44470.1 hypothetical protein [Wenyingzhuangia heitensis]